MSAPRIAAVIGSPVAHSLSPVIHQAAFDAAGVNWTYTAWDIGAGLLALAMYVAHEWTLIVEKGES